MKNAISLFIFYPSIKILNYLFYNDHNILNIQYKNLILIILEICKGGSDSCNGLMILEICKGGMAQAACLYIIFSIK